MDEQVAEITADPVTGEVIEPPSTVDSLASRGPPRPASHLDLSPVFFHRRMSSLDGVGPRVSGFMQGILAWTTCAIQVVNCTSEPDRSTLNCTHIARDRRRTRIPPEFRGFRGARYWDRTSDLFRVREARYRCANRAREGCSVVMRGGDGIRTRVNGFAGRCLAARPRHRVWFDPRVVIALESGDPRTRADDETRTRDPHLGKVMRYQLRYIRIAPPCGA